MKKSILFLALLSLVFGFSQILTPYQPTQTHPKVQFDYWVYSICGGTGSTSQYPLVASNATEMDNIFNTSNSNTTLYQSGRTNNARILDWQSVAELSAIGINLPNSGNYFGFKIQGTFIPTETGNYTFTMESDDASDFKINGTTVVYTYAGQALPALGTHSGTIYLVAGKSYSFIARIQQGGGGFGMRLYWKSPSQAAPSSYTSVLPASTYYPSWTHNLQEMVSTPYMDGTTAAKAAPNAKYIQTAFNNYTDGVYWINLPYVGPTQVYCLLNSAIDGGGWMMAMKATRSTTFAYSSTHWTSVTTLNSSDTTRNDADAKFNTMNYFFAKDMMALWPDIPSNYGSSSTGGSVNLSGSYNNWCWLQNNFNNGIRITPIYFFSTASNLFFGDAFNFAGKGTAFSSQTDVRFYGFNYTGNATGAVRWGFGWNENGGGLYPYGDQGSNDVYGGIGMAAGSFSAGDYISCCYYNYGINRSARVEVYIR